MPPLYGGALLMLATGIDWRLFSDEPANRVTTAKILYPVGLTSVNRLMNNYFIQ